jgi:hypothetical protein
MTEQSGQSVILNLSSVIWTSLRRVILCAFAVNSAFCDEIHETSYRCSLLCICWNRHGHRSGRYLALLQSKFGSRGTSQPRVAEYLDYLRCGNRRGSGSASLDLPAPSQSFCPTTSQRLGGTESIELRISGSSLFEPRSGISKAGCGS